MFNSEVNSTIIQDVISVGVRDSSPIEDKITEEQIHIQLEQKIPSPLEIKLLSAAQDNQVDDIQLLLQLNPLIDISAISNQKHFTLIHFASFNNQYDLIMQFIYFYTQQFDLSLQKLPELQEGKYKTERLELYGFSAMHFAAYRGNIIVMDYLLEQGADIFQINEHGMNILHISAQGDQPASVIYAYEHGIFIDGLDNKGGSPIHWSCYYGCEQSTIFLLSILPDCPPYYPLNLLDHQLLSPLHLAVMSGNTRLVKKLLIAGADKSLQGKDRKTPADLALENDFHNIYNLLTVDGTLFKEYYNIKPGLKRQRKNYFQLFRFLGLLLYQTGTYYIFLSTDEVSIIPQYLIYVTLFSIFILFLLFIILVYRDPGYLILNKQSLQMLLKNNESYDICPTCCIIKPPRSKHCDICQICVFVYDHHCPWINNCVGAGNHGIFVTFVFVLICEFLLVSSQIIIKLRENFFTDQDLVDIIKYSLITINLILGFIFTVALILLFVNQSINLLSGKTTLERLKNQEQQRFSQKANPRRQSSEQLMSPTSPSLRSSLIQGTMRQQTKSSLSLTNCYKMCFTNVKDMEQIKNSSK